MFSFKPNEQITNKDYLFGRCGSYQSFQVLKSTITRGTNCQLQGERRFGKTSILLCLYNDLFNTGSYVPIYLDFKRENKYKGTANVFRFITSKIVQELTTLGLVDDTILVRGLSIKPSKIVENIYEELLNIPDFRIAGIFEDIIQQFSSLLDASFILLIDEYEYLMTESLDSPEGFTVLRNLSDAPREKKYKPLTYVISGSKSWDTLCTKIGSPELNNQGASPIYVGDISRDDFFGMLDFYYTEFPEYNAYPTLGKLQLYHLSGGIPYYAKKIGETVITAGEKQITYNILKQDFESVWTNLEDAEIKIILEVISNREIKERNALYNLIDRGILRKNGNNVTVNGKLLSDFFTDRLKSRNHDLLLPAKHEVNIDMIFGLIEKINKNYKNKGNGDYLFEPIISENSQRQLMSKKSMNINDFRAFVNTIYTTVFERTSISNQKLFRLPHGFRKDHDFIKRIDSLRQELHHLTDSKSYQLRKDQITRADLFNFYLKNPMEPKDSDLALFQVEVYNDFKQYLHSLDKHYS